MAAVGNFRKGAEASHEASKGGGQFAKTHYLQIEDGKQEFVRFLTDEPDWIVVNQHQMIPTKPKPDGFEGNWPEKMGAVCRADEAFAGIFYTDDDSKRHACYICEFMVDGKRIKKPGGRTWALACLREEVIGDGSEAMGGPALKGKVIGMRDQVREVVKMGEDGKPGDPYMEKAIVVVNQGYKNFFSSIEGFAGHYKTALDRDYLIKRSGDDKDTTYKIIPMDPIVLDGGKVFDVREPEFRAKYEPIPDLPELVTERASDQLYARFFDPRVKVDKEGNVVPSGQAAAAPTKSESAGDVDQSRLNALANRVTSYAQPSGEGASAATEPPADAPASEPAGEPAAPAAPAGGGGMRNFD